MAIRACSIIMLALFYFLYLLRFVIGIKNGVEVIAIGRGKKSAKARAIEIVMALVETASIPIEIISILFCSPPKSKLVGAVLISAQLLSVVIFFMSTKSMRLNWRFGIPGAKTSLVTDGIYKVSRNPAYLAFYIMHVSITAAFYNPIMLIECIACIIMLHIQTLQEEKWLIETFKGEYTEYYNSVNRYFGRKRE